LQKVASAFSPESFESSVTAGLLACLIFQAFPPRLIGTVAGDWKIEFNLQLRGQLRTILPLFVAKEVTGFPFNPYPDATGTEP
jgi:hypothetical protein